MIIYLEAVLSVNKCRPVGQRWQVYTQVFYRRKCLSSQPDSYTVHSSDWLPVALVRRPLARLPVTMQKSPPMSFFPPAHQEGAIGWNQEDKLSCHRHPLIDMLQRYSHNAHRSFMLLLCAHAHIQYTQGYTQQRQQMHGFTQNKGIRVRIRVREGVLWCEIQSQGALGDSTPFSHCLRMGEWIIVLFNLQRAEGLTSQMGEPLLRWFLCFSAIWLRAF